MKKIYQTPQISKVIYSENLMEGEILIQSVGMKGSVTGETDTNWQFGNDGTKGDDPDAKGTGRFWDDEY